MKHQTILKRTAWVLALGFASALAFSGCEEANKQPAKSDETKKEQPQQEQTQKEHPEHPKAADTNSSK